MCKKLLILSGAADYTYNDYNLRYDLIQSEAKERGFSDIEFISWPGQKSGVNGILNLFTATEHLSQEILKLESKKEHYQIIAFSWGANVCLNALFNLDKIDYLKKVSLWGIDQFWALYEGFSSQDKIKKTVAKFIQKKVKLDPEFWKYQVPNEFLLQNFKHPCKIIVGFGEFDSESSHDFATYLESFIENSSIQCKKIYGVGHAVTEKNNEYLDCLFGV